jgi:phosphate transport system permease protein
MTDNSVSISDKTVKAAAGFTRPLLLTASEDLLGFVSGHLGRAILFLITATSVVAVLLIFYFVVRESIPFFLTDSFAQTLARIREFFTDTGWYPSATKPRYGALALIVGSLYVTIGALIIAVPLGLLAGIFLSDIAPFNLRQICKPIIEILAAIPSVAYGFFAVLVFAPWLQNHFGFSTGANALNASIILAIMALPTIISVSEDAMTAIGRETREASYGLGATRAETIVKVVIPSAHSGILAAVILGMMRAIGETMVVWMASGNATRIPSPWWNLSQSIRTMTATIAGDMGETPKDSEHYYALFTVGLTLLLFTFGLNLVSENLLSRIMKNSRGGK